MPVEFVNIGFGNSVQLERIIAVVRPDSAPVRKMREGARADKRLVDASQGRKVRSVIITDSNHVILSANELETLTLRLNRKELLMKEH